MKMNQNGEKHRKCVTNCSKIRPNPTYVQLFGCHVESNDLIKHEDNKEDEEDAIN